MDGMNNAAGGGGPAHDRGMEARLAVLEEIAAASKQGMADLRQDARETNRRIEALHAALERDFRTMHAALERDFRLLFGAIITVAIGLAALVGHSLHWF